MSYSFRYFYLGKDKVLLHGETWGCMAGVMPHGSATSRVHGIIIDPTMVVDLNTGLPFATNAAWVYDYRTAAFKDFVPEYVTAIRTAGIVSRKIMVSLGWEGTTPADTAAIRDGFIGNGGLMQYFKQEHTPVTRAEMVLGCYMGCILHRDISRLYGWYKLLKYGNAARHGEFFSMVLGACLTANRNPDEVYLYPGSNYGTPWGADAAGVLVMAAYLDKDKRNKLEYFKDCLVYETTPSKMYSKLYHVAGMPDVVKNLNAVRNIPGTKLDWNGKVISGDDPAKYTKDLREAIAALKVSVDKYLQNYHEKYYAPPAPKVPEPPAPAPAVVDKPKRVRKPRAKRPVAGIGEL